MGEVSEVGIVSEVGGANKTTHDITSSSHVRAAIDREGEREGGRKIVHFLIKAPNFVYMYFDAL